MKKTPMSERFWTKVERSGECLVWTAYRNANGYGVVGREDRRGTCLAHRVAYELTVGPIPEGMRVLHRCDNPPCVNPAHLFLGTMLDNTRDCIAKGRFRTPPRRPTHCPAGHPYNAENTRLRKNGYIRCHACEHARHRKYEDSNRKARNAAALERYHRKREAKAS